MDLRDLQKYLNEHIPLTKALGVEVLEASAEGVKLSAPLAPNVNHVGTVFAGSASAVALLAAWTLVYVRLKNEAPGSRVVVHRNTMVYERPITGTFTAFAAVADPAAWDRFIDTLKRKNRARITLTAILECNGTKVGELEGEFVALRS